MALSDASGPLRSFCKRCIEERANEPRAIASGRRIGGVRFDQERRSIAAQKIAAEIFRNVDDKLDLTAREQIVSFRFGLHLPDEVEVGAVLHRVEQRSSLRALVGQKHRGGQMPRIGIDREAEERELNQRNAEHHGEGEPVAPHLRELLRDDAAQALERKSREVVSCCGFVRVPSN